MHGDFSRRQRTQNTQYTRVLMQQGRVQLDADHNAQGELLEARTETEAVDVIGPVGVPKNTPSFEISSSPPTIGPGHLYLDGLLLANPQLATFSDQPYLPGATLPAQSGEYLAYVEAFERAVNAAEDPSLREVALGGPDTTLRRQVVWQVKLHRLGNLNPTIARTAGDAFIATQRAPKTGRMNAQAVAVVAADRPCLVPNSAAYRRLDNLLYRVEIHAAPNGNEQGATFKWSRENGAFGSAATANGAVFTVDSLGRDDFVRFARNRWVEVLDDARTLTQSGVLRRIIAVDPDQNQLTLDQAVAVGPRPYLRLWDQDSDAIPLTPNNWTEIEAGIQIQFAPGTYQAGDYWLIPARTALTSNDGSVLAQTGDIEWPRNNLGPLPQPRTGTVHHFAGLAILGFDNTTWTRRHDLRVPFPALTNLAAQDVSFDNSAGLLPSATNVQTAIEELARRNQGDCTLVLGPSDDLAQRLNELPPGGGRICLREGTYRLSQPLLFQNRGDLTISGAGPSTLLTIGSHETALRFENCSSVQVSDLAVVTGVARGAQRVHLRGALHFENCATVSASQLRITTRAQDALESTGITVQQAEQASVRDCTLLIGGRQQGLLFLGVAHVQATHNTLDVDATESPLNPAERKRAARELVRDAGLGPRPDGDQRFEIESNGATVHFYTPDTLRRRWPELLRAAPFTGRGDQALLLHLQSLALQLLQNQGTVGNDRTLRGWYADTYRQARPTGARAIVVAGPVLPDLPDGGPTRSVRLNDNRIARFSGGIHLGVSNRKRTVAPLGEVWIANNELRLTRNAADTRDCFGIFVGDCTSLRITGNTLSLTQMGGHKLRDGIRIYGAQGRLLVVRDNRIDPAYLVGIRFVPTRLVERPQWIVTDNLCPRNPPISLGDPARGISQGSVASRVRGEEWNVGL